MASLEQALGLVAELGQVRDVLVVDDLGEDLEQVRILAGEQPGHGHHVRVRAQPVGEPVDRHRPRLPVRPEPQRPLLAPIQQPGSKGACSLSSHGPDSQRRLHSGRSISPMFRFRSMNSIRFATTALTPPASPRNLGNRRRPMPREPLRLQLPASIRRAITISNARSPSRFRNGLGRLPPARRFAIGDEPVPAVDVPVQFLLERNHPRADPLMLLPSRIQSFAVGTPEAHTAAAQRLRVGAPANPARARTPMAGLRQRELLQLRAGELVELAPTPAT